VIGNHLDYLMAVVGCPSTVILVLRVNTRLTVAILRQSRESYQLHVAQCSIKLTPFL
jgi:ubiquinone biosynthesis protein COQ9